MLLEDATSQSFMNLSMSVLLLGSTVNRNLRLCQWYF